MIAEIRYALESRLKTWADAQSPAIPVAWQNVPFTPPVTRYLRAFLLPAETVTQTLDGDHRRYTGVFQVSILVPVGNGPGAGETIAEAIEALYPADLVLGDTSFDLYIVSPMSVYPSLQDSDWYTIPVSCQYRVDTV